MPNSNVHFYIRINLENSGSPQKEKQISRTFFGSPGNTYTTCMQLKMQQKIELVCTPNSLAAAPQAQPMLLEPSMRSTIEPMTCFCLLALVRYKRARMANAGVRTYPISG
jgi:hypothetical protein